MSPRERYAGIVVGGSRDGEMIACEVPKLRIPRPRRKPVEYSGGFALPMPGDNKPLIETYDFVDPTEGGLGRWVLRETR